MRMIIIYTECAPFDAPVISLLSRLEALRSVQFSRQYTATHFHFRADQSASRYSHQNRSSQFESFANIYLRTLILALTGAHPATLEAIHLAATYHAPPITQGPAGESKRKRSRSSLRLRLRPAGESKRKRSRSSLRLRLRPPGITPEALRPSPEEPLQQAPQLHRSWPCGACDGCHHRHRPLHRPWS